MSENPNPFESSEHPASAAFRAVCAHLDEQRIEYRSKPELARLQFRVTEKGAVMRTSCAFSRCGGLLRVQVSYPVLAPKPLWASTAELVARANFGLPVGNFELDLRDGEILFRYSLMIEGGVVSDEILGRVFSTSFGTAGRYFPAFMGHFYGGMTAEDAVFLVEALSFDGTEPELQGPEPQDALRQQVARNISRRPAGSSPVPPQKAPSDGPKHRKPRKARGAQSGDNAERPPEESGGSDRKAA